MPHSNSQQHVYIFADSAICCAGSTTDASLQKEICKQRTSSSLFSRISIAEKQFSAGIIPDTFLIKEKGSAKTRIETILDTVLLPIEAQIRHIIQTYGAHRIGICIGSCDNGSEKSLAAHKVFFGSGSFPDGYKLEDQNPSSIAAYIACKMQITGPSVAIATACASSATAVIEAAELIKAGMCDAVITGGIDSASQTVLLGFGALEALSPTECNPFSINRNGITIGEAAAFFILTKDIPASGDYVKLLGYGESADANHMTAPLETGEGAAAAMKAALLSANLSTTDINYINLHGTGTELNDAMESRAIASLFPGYQHIPVSSTKAVTGHTLGAAGALELSICMRVLYDRTMEGRLPVHRWDGMPDSSLPALHFAEHDEYIQPPSICMSNSFAFGGCNVSLIIGKKT